MKKINFAKLFLSIIVCLGAGFLGSIFTAPSIKTWYAGIEKPSFNPPNWIFGPVWTTLFILMGIALYIIWQKDFPQKSKSISIFTIQLSFNVLWSLIFFGLRQPGIAFLEILILWVAILFTIINFYKTSKISAYLLIPYILWVSFAIILNYNIWILNI